MNLYQKITGFITLCIIGITFAIIGVCFSTPYTGIFITECIAISVSELLIGISSIILLKKTDSILPFSCNILIISIFYFVFTLIMIIPAVYDIKLRYFILLHCIGFILSIISYCTFHMGEHYIKVQESADKIALLNKKR